MMAASQDLLVRDLPCEVIGLRDETVDRWTLHSLRDPRRPYRIALCSECYLLGMQINAGAAHPAAPSRRFIFRILTVYLCTPLGVSLRSPKSEH
jgi:hypothetical protein